MNTILVATDHSTTAQNAVNYTAHLAKVTGSELILFNVFKLSVHSRNSITTSTSSIDNQLHESEERLQGLCDELEGSFGINVRWEIGKDDTIDSLKTFMKDHIVDLVVMGIESNLTEYKLFGNTTTAAIKLMQFPLLVVPHDVAFNGLKKITYACDVSYLKENCDLSVLKDFVQDFNAELDVLHVITNHPGMDNNPELENTVDGMLANLPHEYKYVHNTKVSEGIKEGIEQSPTDLLVMIPHKLGFFESFIKGSHTSHMTVVTRVPLLVIPNEKVC